MDKPGGVFVRKAAQMPEDDQILLQSAARVVLMGGEGSLSVQLAERHRARFAARGLAGAIDSARDILPGDRPERSRTSRCRPICSSSMASAASVRTAANTAFSPIANSSPLQTATGKKKTSGGVGCYEPHFPPAPWINVVANPRCGFLVSESGLGYTWTGNSQQFRLTPWSNDPVSDPPAEVVYLRDEETGEVWTPTPRPLGLACADAGAARPGIHDASSSTVMDSGRNCVSSCRPRIRSR